MTTPTNPQRAIKVQQDDLLVDNMTQKDAIHPHPSVLPEALARSHVSTPLDDSTVDGSLRDAKTLVRLDKLSKSYVEAGTSRLILDELNQSFNEGEFICLLGKSGSGKSTLLNLISGIDEPTSGDVFIRDISSQNHINNPTTNGAPEFSSITGLTERKRTLFRRQHIGIVFQFFNLIPTLTVLENVTLPLELAGGSQDEIANASHLLDRVGLADRIATYPDKLSGGEQQRVAIARALVHDPLLILADEPTGNLDEETGDTVLSLLLELTRGAGKTLIMATHAADVAQQANRVLHLVQGKLVNPKKQ